MHDFCPDEVLVDRPPEPHIQLMIGKVASLYDITVQTLRHYDKIGLFRPEVINPDTGYRYYTVPQLRQLEYILFLRQLHFSLPEIQQAMDALRGGGELSDILESRNRTLEDEIQKLQAMRDVIHSVSYMEKIQPEPLGKICIQVCSPPRSFLVRQIEPLHAADPAFALRLLEHRKALLGKMPPIQTDYSFGATVSISSCRDTGDLCYTGILLDPGPYGAAPPPGLVEFPEGYYASIRFHRNVTRPEEAYWTLIGFLEDHCFRADDTILEAGIDPSFSSISRISELTELQVHIYLD